MPGTVPFATASIAAALLAYSPTSILSTDRPVHLALLTLVCLSASLLIIASRLRSGKSYLHDRTAESAYIPLQYQQNPPVKRHNHALSKPVLYLVIFGAAVALTVRIDLQRRLFLASECTTRSIQVWLPFLISVYDALRFQKLVLSRQDEEDDDFDTNAYHDLVRYIRLRWLSSSWRYVPTTFLLSLGCHMVAGLWLSSESSHICPLSSSDLVTIPRLQWLALLLDVALSIAVLELALGANMSPTAFLSAPNAWLAATITSLIIWTVVSISVLSLQPENRDWIFLQPGRTRTATMFIMLYQALYLTAFALSSLYSVATVGLLHTSIALTAICALVPGFRFIWVARRPYPPISSVNLTFSFVLIYFAWSMYQRLRRTMHSSADGPSLAYRLAVFVAFIVLIYPGLFKSNTVFYHPIDLLMYDAQNKYLRYLDTAARSKNLEEAVQAYQKRYQERPPPAFDTWFEYAKNKSVWITDEFDQIYTDLLPFRTVSPADLRKQTWEMVSNPWNEISGITIRNGNAAVQENVLPTHRWMLEGVVQLLDNFAAYLPDMDLAFNLNDESRTALTYQTRQTLEEKARVSQFRGVKTFSGSRADGWRDIPEEAISETIFDNWSFQNTFAEWAATTCPYASAARRSVKPLFRSQLCLECAAGHNLGQFVSNWSIAADPCHQPDLSSLHGFYLSPAAFKATHELRPVFSQSKAPGFSDILYPSAWNYVEKVTYAPTNESDGEQNSFPDPLFSEKQDVLFWRGSTTEGVSAGLGAWRGMARQRLVHMANNLTRSEHDEITLLLPDQRHRERFTYVRVPGSSLRDLGLTSDIQLVDGIARCGGRDCDEQTAEFGSAEPENFQSHWRYKYLIDLDGAGFSGRFLAFLRSRSLPFKSALFREWYDSRLVPWIHFVPLDLRLHGVWSTLAYFAGVQGTDASGKSWYWNAHAREASLIAESGREWSQKALRKEDMEVYFFRLLLEWGRLTDDNRDDLGFTIES